MNGFTKDQLATLKALGFEAQDDMLCNKAKGTITAIVADHSGRGRKYKLAKNYGTNYCYHAWGDVREICFSFERLIKAIS